MLSIITQAFYLMTFPLISMYLYENYAIQSSGNWVTNIFPNLNSLVPLLLVWIGVTFGSLGKYYKKYFRVLYSLLLFLIVALTNGADFDHDLFAWFYISLLFIFEGRSKQTDERILNLSKLTIVLIYFMSGFWKIYYSIAALFNERSGYFHLDGLKKIIAESHLYLQYQWDFLYSIPNGILLVLGLFVIVLELSGLFFYVKRKTLLHFWASAIIVFHLLTVIAMRIEFVSNIILIGIIFCLKMPKKEQSNPSLH